MGSDLIPQINSIQPNWQHAWPSPRPGLMLNLHILELKIKEQFILDLISLTEACLRWKDMWLKTTSLWAISNTSLSSLIATWRYSSIWRGCASSPTLFSASYQPPHHRENHLYRVLFCGWSRWSAPLRWWGCSKIRNMYPMSELIITILKKKNHFKWMLKFICSKRDDFYYYVLTSFILSFAILRNISF